MERHIPALKPSGIIYFFNNNDIIDNAIVDQDYQVTQFTFKTDGEVVLTDVFPFPIWKRILLNYTPYSWLNRYSHLFVALKGILKSSIGWRGSTTATTRLPQTNIAEQNAKHHKTLQRPSFTVDPGTKLQRDIKDYIDISMAHLIRISNLTRTNNIPLLVVWVPSKEEMFDTDQGSPIMRLFKTSRKMIKKLENGNRFLFFDTVSRISYTKDWVKQKELYHQSDGHFNTRGSEWFQKIVQPKVLQFSTKF
jgi:hypothetical protein